jgi:hypothetical protein
MHQGAFQIGEIRQSGQKSPKMGRYSCLEPTKIGF